ncbi:MAG: 16S rRNA (cytosine(1402)-N(4))-methyltransferase RsmH [Actinomycetaceae bacterium]|nr:16S rRNA (cytosine(1402)-N(4))-methyltransferase RsmH [Actinomycetaceae bacterium]
MTQRAIATHDIATVHTPVLLDSVLALLEPSLFRRDKGPARMVDCTLGMGGHTEAVLATWPHVAVIGIDRDRDAIELAQRRLKKYSDRFKAVHATYDCVDDVVQQAGWTEGADAILMDLGVSSLQLDEDSRGFAYSRDTALDMRMDQNSGRTAAELLNTASLAELTRILTTYGEERFARRIAQRIVDQRNREPLASTGQLVELIRDAIPAPARRTGGNPAKRTFQALRIAVNEELEILSQAIPAALSALRIGGRLVVESYHSLEDRIVKSAFRRGSQSNVPHDLPLIPQEHAPYLSVLTRKAIQATPEDIEKNPRAASVRLRAVEITRPYPLARKG